MVGVAGVQIGLFQFHDFVELLFVDFADLVFVRHTGTFGNAGRLFQQRRCRRAFAGKVKTAITVHIHDHGNRHAAFVELLHELTKVDAEFTERRSDWRRGRSLAARDLEFCGADELFCHLFYFARRAIGPAAKRLMLIRLQRFNLPMFQLNRRGPAENVDDDTHAAAGFVDRVDFPFKVFKRAFIDLDAISLFHANV